MILEIMRPKYTARMQKKKLKEAYREKSNHSLSRSSRNESLENEEKVVNPPQIPTVRKSRRSAERKSPFSEMPMMIPISRHPVILMIRVGHGKREWDDSWMNRDNENLSAVPMKPPRPAKKIDLTIKIQF
jgi:hypothetical protein